jgi:hypothetical protein
VTPLPSSSQGRAPVHINSRQLARPEAAPPPAPGVVQLHFEAGHGFAYFTAASLIPANSIIGGSMSVFNGGQSVGSISFNNLQLNADMQPGDFITLPNFSSLGDIWPTGELIYTVDVTIRGALTETNGDIFVNQALGYNDLPNFAPSIAETAQTISGGGDMILNIYGVFTGDAPLVVLESFVVPAGAVRVISSGQINVDLSLVRGFDLSHLAEYLLTVSQAGYADTVVYRFVPAQPGTFNPAP